MIAAPNKRSPKHWSQASCRQCLSWISSATQSCHPTPSALPGDSSAQRSALNIRTQSPGFTPPQGRYFLLPVLPIRHAQLSPAPGCPPTGPPPTLHYHPSTLAGLTYSGTWGLCIHTASWVVSNPRAHNNYSPEYPFRCSPLLAHSSIAEVECRQVLPHCVVAVTQGHRCLLGKCGAVAVERTAASKLSTAGGRVDPRIPHHDRHRTRAAAGALLRHGPSP